MSLISTLISRFKRLSLKKKLSVFVTVFTLISFLVSSVGIATYLVVASCADLVHEMKAMADILGANCAAPLRFHVADDAQATLEFLTAAPNVREAILFLPDGTPFASYIRPGDSPSMQYPLLEEGHGFSRKYAVLVRHVYHDGDHIGTVFLVTGLESLYRGLRNSLLVLAVVSACGSVVGLLFAHLYLGIIAKPITNLVRTANTILDSGDYSLRAHKFADDDLGELTDRFNRMIEDIQLRDDELQRAHGELERQHYELRVEQETLKEVRKREHELQDQLVRSERLESLGMLAGGVAHDLNNILGPIVGYPEFILEELAEDDPVRDDVIQIQKAAQKAAAVIQDLLTLGRRGSYVKEQININSLIEEYLESAGLHSLQHEHPEIRFVRHLDPDTWPIDGSVHHLTQVIMNLVINAVESITEVGTITLTTRSISLDTPRTGLERIPSGEYVELSVQDTGSGIATEDLEHIFEPFYTRKKLGRSGSGLGLAVVYGVVKDLGGAIDVGSKQDEGTTFHIFFPPSQLALETPIIPPRDYRGSERILIIDDVREQRDLAARILEGLGYSTATAPSGREGLKCVEYDHFNLIILDMIMEDDFDGLDTFRAIRKRVPDQKCIIASGFSESDRVKAAQTEGAGAFVAKPYTRDLLAEVVRLELDYKPRSSVKD